MTSLSRRVWLEGYIAVRYLHDQLYLTVERLLYGHARLHLCTPEGIIDSW